MSNELAKTIERLELWADHLEPHFMTPFIADVLTLIGTAKAAQKAAEMLENAEDVSVTCDEEGSTELMVCSHVVDHAVAILRGGCTL